jgi:hypothetical protein
MTIRSLIRKMDRIEARVRKNTHLAVLDRQRPDPQEEPLWLPLPDRNGKPTPQRMAYESSADVTGYGGAAGGGKTDLALGLAVTSHLRSALFRREATQLRAMIDRARELLVGHGRLNEDSGVWRDLPGGRQIEFCGVKDRGHENKYRGRPKDLLVLDEADQFLEAQFRFLAGWVRTTIPGQRCRILLTFNPPSTPEGQWITQYFGAWLDPCHPRPAKPGELRWFTTVEGKEVECKNGEPFEHNGQLIKPQSRTFIPAKLSDNPYLMTTSYGATLQAMPEPLRSQLLYGDFTAGMKDDDWQVIPTEWIRNAQARWTPEKPARTYMTCLGVDVARGGSDKTVLARRYGNWFAPLEKHPGQSTPDGASVVGHIAKALAERADRVADVNIDVIGIGASVYDGCSAIHVSPNAINFGEGTERTDRTGQLHFRNVRAWAYWNLRESLDPDKGDKLALPPDSELLADLTAARWKMTAQGIQLESKEDIKKRIGRSPDCGDAVVMAAMPQVPAPRILLPEPGKGSLVDSAPPGVFIGNENKHGGCDPKDTSGFSSGGGVWNELPGQW